MNTFAQTVEEHNGVGGFLFFFLVLGFGWFFFFYEGIIKSIKAQLYCSSKSSTVALQRWLTVLWFGISVRKESLKKL